MIFIRSQPFKNRMAVVSREPIITPQPVFLKPFGESSAITWYLVTSTAVQVLGKQDTTKCACTSLGARNVQFWHRGQPFLAHHKRFCFVLVILFVFLFWFI